MSVIIDRTCNDAGKSLPNRQRFLNREREAVREAVRRRIDGGNMGDVLGKDRTKVRTGRNFEPHIHHNPRKGDNVHVAPGNRTYLKGDKIKRPIGGDAAGGGNGAGNGDSEDDFEFELTREEFLEVFFEDLELPDMTKTMLQEAVTFKVHRAGYSRSGTPSSINVARTMRRAMGRRLALGRPTKEEMQDAQQALLFAQQDGDYEMIALAQFKLMELQRRSRGVPYVDPVDLQFNRFEKKPEPHTSAVIFLLMDCSASMGPDRKDLAKRFFLLLYLFLERQYEKVRVVFIRHTETAEEVNEEAFFHSTKSGGTIVSSALAKMLEVQERDYPLDTWNVYAAQASDGDNLYSDSGECLRLLREKILPAVQYFAYVEAKPTSYNLSGTSLWQCYNQLGEVRKFQKRRVNEPKDIFGVLQDLFAKGK